MTFDQQCQCVNPNHEGGRCANTTEMHDLCGPCQSEGAIRMKTTDGILETILNEICAVARDSVYGWRSGHRFREEVQRVLCRHLPSELVKVPHVHGIDWQGLRRAIAQGIFNWMDVAVMADATIIDHFEKELRRCFPVEPVRSVGDGIIDDTRAIQAATDAASDPCPYVGAIHGAQCVRRGEHIEHWIPVEQSHHVIALVKELRQ